MSKYHAAVARLEAAAVQHSGAHRAALTEHVASTRLWYKHLSGAGGGARCGGGCGGCGGAVAGKEAAAVAAARSTRQLELLTEQVGGQPHLE